ncbi:MAG: cupin domain-containing protein, partial [Gammaproteobacteria bacterium]|nr:cupin domain-containing protein [Gammaproteobacteria bacterium]
MHYVCGAIHVLNLPLNRLMVVSSRGTTNTQDQVIKVRANFAETVAVAPETWRWQPSPQPGVERVMLDRIGKEVAVATSFVRYAQHSKFPAHNHDLGEEFIVLEGEFGDEHGRYPPVSYVRNPPGTSHTPFSDPGCLIFVKLRQFAPADNRQFAERIDIEPVEIGWRTSELHRYEGEVVQSIGCAGDVDV